MRVIEVFHDKSTRTYRLTCVVTEDEMRQYGDPAPKRTAMEEARLAAAEEQKRFMNWWEKNHRDPKKAYETRVKTLGEVPWVDDVVMFVPPDEEWK